MGQLGPQRAFASEGTHEIGIVSNLTFITDGMQKILENMEMRDRVQTKKNWNDQIHDLWTTGCSKTVSYS